LLHLAKLEKLERLYLAHTKVTDAGLKQIAGLTALRILSLEATAVTDAGLAELKPLVNLETLFLNETQITDEGLGHLAAFPNLKNVFLSHTQVTGKKPWLASLPKLEHVSLNGAPLTDASLPQFHQAVALKNLELYEIDLSAEAIAELRVALPKTNIFVDRLRIAVAGYDEPPGPERELTLALQPVQPPISERLAQTQETPHFQRHVIPVLGRLGCNGRACHGSFQGKGGFRLSMFGYDFAMDHENLSERIDLDSPAESLILNKPTSADNHEGGLRLPPGGWEQSLLRAWIEGGAPSVPQPAVKFVRLEVTPTEVLFAKQGETAKLKAVAVWSDGAREDVTPLTRFQTNDEGVATVSPEGVIKSVGPGDTYIVSFYDNGIVSTQTILPITEQTGDEFPETPTPTKIDELVVAKLSKLGVVPADLATDGEFLRRVSIDMIGTLPTPLELEAFVADTSPDKRSKKIDELLERPEYITWWTTRLSDLTGSNAGYLGSTEMASHTAEQWRQWIERRVEDNDGWDEIVAGIVLARSRTGEPYRDFIARQSEYARRKQPADYAADNDLPHFWFRDNISLPTDKALAFGYTFLGVRLQCAQCHKHPFDQWSKQDFELFTEFFTRIKRGQAPDAKAYHTQMREMLGVPVKLDTAALRRQSYMRIAAEGRPIPWNEIYIEPPKAKPQPGKLLGGEEIDLNQYDDPRAPLMEWLLTEPNQYFAKAFVNRIWSNYFHVGIINPPDDLNLANPPSNKALLDWLVQNFIEQGYDIKWLHRTIANSATYQRSWRHNASNKTDERNFSRAVIRRLPAEVAVDALRQATASDAVLAKMPGQVINRKIGNHPRSYQARTIDYSLLIFGKPLRTTNCDCERQSDPTLLQSLYVRNDGELLDMLQRNDGWLTQLGKEDLPKEELTAAIQAAYIRTLSRQPTTKETADCHAHIATAETQQEGLRDILWALLNTQEFITNH